MSSGKKTQFGFVLKHRLLGAGVLLLIGVVFIPWLLGGPKPENIPNKIKTQKVDEVVSIEPITDDVFVAKVTPIDKAKKNNLGIEKKSKESAKEPAKEPAKLLSSGWMVQIGIFRDANGAKKVIEDLAKKEILASKTTVDTKYGKKTATRVWVGPFISKQQAINAKNEITEKTKRAGFVRTYP